MKKKHPVIWDFPNALELPIMDQHDIVFRLFSLCSFCRLPLPLSLLSGWVVTVGIVRQSLRLSRVALPPSYSPRPSTLTRRLKKGNGVKQLQTFQRPIERTESKWQEKHQKASLWEWLLCSFKSWNNPFALHNAFWDKFWNATTTSSDVGILL